MVHGAPDNFDIRPTSVTYPVADLAEHAARTGSIDVFDRRGDVIYAEVFGASLTHWDSDTQGAGSTVAAVTTTSRMGARSIELHVAAVSSAWAMLIGRFPYRVLSKIGMECAFTVDNNVQDIIFRLTLFTGTRSMMAQLRYNPSTDTLDRRTGFSTYADIDTSLDLLANDKMFHIVKMVFDAVDEEWERVMVDSLDYDLSGLAMYAVDDTTAPYMLVEILAEGDGANAADIYIDTFILTQDEP